MAKTEYAGGIDFTSFIDKDGFQHSLTSRKETSLESYVDLQATIALAIQEGAIPFVRDYNKAELDKPASKYPTDPQEPVSVLAQAKQLGGEVTYVTPEEVASIASGLLEIPEGHNYLGMKPGKLEEIRENDSYQVRAETYSWDGKQFINFFSGSSDKAVAGYYYGQDWAKDEFNKMFHWSPAQVDKAPIPGGNVLLYILGVKGKNSDVIYQNIKQVEPA